MGAASSRHRAYPWTRFSSTPRRDRRRSTPTADGDPQHSDHVLIVRGGRDAPARKGRVHGAVTHHHFSRGSGVRSPLQDLDHSPIARLGSKAVDDLHPLFPPVWDYNPSRNGFPEKNVVRSPTRGLTRSRMIEPRNHASM